jgi:hypothetical protein
MLASPDPNFERNVFINCPFDDDYTRLLETLLFTIIFLGFEPRIATERTDSGEQRLHKICQLIAVSKYSIHDLSRLRATELDEYYRLNMPFELGIDYGFRNVNHTYLNEKKFLVIASTRFDYAKAISDLAGVDIKAHNNDPRIIIQLVRNWLKQFTQEQISPPEKIWKKFNVFIVNFYDKRVDEGFSDDDIYSMPTGEFIGYIREWLMQNNEGNELPALPLSVSN